MLCCDHCFQDRALCTKIIPEHSTEQGKCFICHTQDGYLIDSRKLTDYFELLCEIYRPDNNGKLLVDWLIDDWKLFKIDRTSANNLLCKILGDSERVRKNFSPSELCESDQLDRWKQLRDELQYKNRFFPKTPFDREHLRILLSNLILDEGDYINQWYRARIEKQGKPYDAEKMGAPPKDIVTYGRVNPVGIPCLYLSSDKLTAATEVRPYPGEKICVATFTVQDNLTLVDLRNPLYLISPFLFDDAESIASIRGNIGFLERLGQELTTPVLPNSAAIYYIPSQYLCEFIKKCGYHGVVYSSSVSQGINLALFDPIRASVNDNSVEEFNINHVEVKMSPVAEHSA